MIEPSWMVEHLNKMLMGIAGIFSAGVAWALMRFRVDDLNTKLDTFLEREEAEAREISRRLDEQQEAIRDNAETSKLIKQDVSHLKDTVDHFIDDKQADERARRSAEIQLDLLKNSGLLKPPSKD